MGQVSKLDRILNNKVFEIDFFTDTEYTDQIVFPCAKVIPITELLNNTDKKYCRRVVRDVIKCFWDIIIDKMIYDGYVFIFPTGTIKMGVGSVNRLAKNTPLEKIISGELPVFPRLILNKKKVRGFFKVYFGWTFRNKLKEEMDGGRQYGVFKVV